MKKDELIKKYGPTMRIPDLAEVFNCTKGNIYNKLSQGKFEIDTFKVAGAVMADTMDVAEYFENVRLEGRLKRDS